MFTTLLLIMGSMAMKDVASSISTYLVSRNHGVVAGIADGLGDIFAVLSIGVTGVLTVAHGASASTFEAFGALLVGSVLGGWAGTHLGKRLSDHLDGKPGG